MYNIDPDNFRVSPEGRNGLEGAQNRRLKIWTETIFTKIAVKTICISLNLFLPYLIHYKELVAPFYIKKIVKIFSLILFN